MKTSTHLDLSLLRLPASTAFYSSKAHAGQEDNWVQTMPDKGWNTILRPSALRPSFDKRWNPGDFELVK